MSKKAILASMVILALAAIGIFFWSGQYPKDSSIVTPSGTKDEISAVSGSDGGKNAPTELVPNKASADIGNIRIKFERTDDLFALVRELSSNAYAGNPDAMWLVSRSYEYCAAFAASPANYARDTDVMAAASPQTSSGMNASRNKVAKRCAGFTPKDAITRDILLESQLAAAKAGSLPAEAALFAGQQPMSHDAEYGNDLIDRVRRSRDPEAYLALSTAMGLVASGEEGGLGQIYGTENAELAWQLAACQLGLDCSSGGALMTMYCANGGICSEVAGQDFRAFVFDAGIPRQGADRINRMVSLILSSRR